MFPKVVQVIPMKDYSVYVYFEDGKIVYYDMSKMIEKEAFRSLHDIDVFIDTCTVMNDTLAWEHCPNPRMNAPTGSGGTSGRRWIRKFI